MNPVMAYNPLILPGVPSMKNEPVITVTGIGAIIGAIITLITAFGPTLSAEQTAAILGLWAVAGPIILGLIARSHVTPSP